MIVTPTRLFALAYGTFAIGAYSVNNMEQILGLFRGHEQAQAPFILALSRKARRYAGSRMLESMVMAATEQFPKAIFAVHLDHGDEESCYDAIASGVYSSIMIDAADQPFEKNIAITRRVVERAHERGVSVEAELGMLGGVEDERHVDESAAFLTDPAQAAEFVKRTGVDSLAIAIGTSHGPYKFTGRQGINLERLQALQQQLPGFPFVLHGASAVSQEEVERINAAGGALHAQARGVSSDDVKHAIPLGLTKINIDTDCRLIWTRVHREFFRDHPNEIDFRTPGEAFMQAYAEFIVAKSHLFGSFQHLSAVRRSLLEEGQMRINGR